MKQMKPETKEQVEKVNDKAAPKVQNESVNEEAIIIIKQIII